MKLIGSIFYNNPDTYPPIVNSSRLLASAGYSVELWCRENGEHWNVAWPQGVRVRRIGAPGTSSWREYSAFVRATLGMDCKAARVFIGHDAHGFLPVRILAAKYRRPLVYHCHDFADRELPLPLGSRGVVLFEQLFARTADVVIVPDGERAAVVKRALGLRRDPLVVANAPLNCPVKQTGALRSALTARSLNWERIVLRQGMIGAGHGIEATIRSIPLWTNHNWGFVAIGPGQPDYVAHLNAVARSLQVESQFAVLPAVGYDDLLSYTLDADVGHALYDPIHINNRYITTASNKLMEYIAAGKPVLVSNRPGLSEFVAQYRCGVTADESSPESIAGAVNGLLLNREQSLRLGKAGREAFEQVFCYERQFSPVVEALSELAAN